MQHDDVRQLEEAIAQALAPVLDRRVTGPNAGRIRHLMAKAAVAVLEAVEEAQVSGTRKPS